MAKGRPKKLIDGERGRRLKASIDAAGMSVAEFAEKAGLAEGSVRNIISGQRSLTDDIAIQAAGLLGIRAAYLLNLDAFPTEKAIMQHPAFPFVSALVKAADQAKARDAYLSALGLSVAPNERRAAELGVNENCDHLEEFLADGGSQLVLDGLGQVVRACSLDELAAFEADVDGLVMYAIGKLINGGYKLR